MKITIDLIKDVLNNYGYDDVSLARVSELPKGSIRVEFLVDEYTSMDFIYSISGIVQDIITKAYPEDRFDLFDEPRVMVDSYSISVTFQSYIFDQYK